MTELRHRAGITSSIGTSCNGTKRHPPSTLLLIQSRAARTGRHTALFDRNSSTERSEEHTSELQSLMRISYAVFCLKKKNAMQSRKRENNTKSQSRTDNQESEAQSTVHNYQEDNRQT